MNTLKSLVLSTFALLALSLASTTTASAQATMTSTTLTQNVGTLDQYIYVASITNITAAGSLNQPTTGLLIDKEYMTVTTVTTLGSVFQVGVNRIAGPTTDKSHTSGTTVWTGPPSYFSQQDPSGGCIPSSQPVLPRVVVSTGRVWTCFANGGGSTMGFWAQEGYAFVSAVNCGSKATTTTTTDNGMVPAATGNVVHQFTTNTTGGTTEITCDITPPQTRISTGQGVFIGDVDFLYGAQTTAISAIAAATVKTVTYPASTAAGVAAAGTVAAVGGTYTVTPTSLQLTTTTSGQCFNEKVLFGTPVPFNTDNQKITFDQVFTNSAAATVYQICGALVHYYTAAPAY